MEVRLPEPAFELSPGLHIEQASDCALSAHFQQFQHFDKTGDAKVHFSSIACDELTI
jgi:hypothetical protein